LVLMLFRRLSRTCLMQVLDVLRGGITDERLRKIRRSRRRQLPALGCSCPGNRPVAFAHIPWRLRLGPCPFRHRAHREHGVFVLVSILCAWLCAHFAPGRVARHVFWFVVVGEAIITLAIIHNWTQGWPLWYWLSWPLTWPVSCWIGLLLAGRRADSVTALIRT
jgi:hypothetical protein